jgi:hypothetical protein
MSEPSIISKRVKRWNDFYQFGNPRILFLVNIQEEVPPRPLPHPDRIQARIDWSWEKYGRMMEHLDWLDDDAIPCLDPYTGTEIFAEAFGCKIQRNEVDMPFALPLINSPSQIKTLKKPSHLSSSLSILFEIADNLWAKAGGQALMRLVDIQSPMDISALIWDKNSFYSALINHPDHVKELAYSVKKLLTGFLDEWFSRYGAAFIAHYPDYYMTSGITLSEDEIGSVSQNMFDEFFYNELAELSNRYGRIGIHCCANAEHQWKNLLKIPNLILLNFVQPVSVLKNAYKYFSSHCAQMHVWSGDGDAWTWPDQIPVEARVVLSVDVPTREAAKEAASRLRERIEQDPEMSKVK